MRITIGMVDLMHAFRIAAMSKDSIDELCDLYHAGLVYMGNLSKEETMLPEQACAVTDFFRDIIRNEEARIENH